MFRRALLEVIERWKLLAPTASTRSMSGLCAAVDTAACATTYIQPKHFGVHPENTALRQQSTLRLFGIILPIDIMYLVTGISCSMLLILAVA